jgi:hypothetical protein
MAEPKISSTSIDEQIERIYSDIDLVGQLSASDLQRIESETRDFIARSTIKYFFMLFAVVLIGVPVYNFLVAANGLNTDLVLNLSDLMQQYGATLGPVLGFVIGYYFKTKS